MEGKGVECEEAKCDGEERFDAAGVGRWVRFLAVLERYFRYEVTGLEHVPRSGPGLLVSPHSAMTLDGFLLAKAIRDRTGRLPRGLGDHLLFQIPGLREVFRFFGAVDGTQRNAVRLLSAGELCTVMPGGAKEAWRSSAKRYELLWEGHHGFVRVALRTGAPLIPTVCIGADDALFLPFDTTVWGKRLFGRRVPLLPGFGLGLLPLPVKLRAYVGPQIRFDEPPEAADDEAVVRRCHARVVQTVESMLREGLRARRSYWF